VIDDKKHSLTNSGGQVASINIDEMTAEELYARQQKRDTFLKKAKKAIEVIGYEYKPYYNRPKKHHLGKIILVSHSPLRNIIYRQLIAQNVPTAECLKLIQITDKKELKKIHAERSKKANYGFPYPIRKKKE